MTNLTTEEILQLRKFVDSVEESNKEAVLLSGTLGVVSIRIAREILTLRQEVELLEALNNGLEAPTARCSTRFICIICGKGGGSFLNIRPPQSYNCSHCENKNTMLPKHVHDAVKAQQSEVVARAVEKAINNMLHNVANSYESDDINDPWSVGADHVFNLFALEREVIRKRLREQGDE